MTRTKLASVRIVAARNWMRQQVLDHADAASPPGCGRSQSTTKCESSYVLQSTTPVLLCTTKYCSSTSLYYKVLLQSYSVLQSTTKYYSSTSLYYKVLLQYYSVLQSTTPVLLCTTKYYSSTSLYYKVTPVLLCTRKYYSSTTLYYKVVHQY